MELLNLLSSITSKPRMYADKEVAYKTHEFSIPKAR